MIRLLDVAGVLLPWAMFAGIFVTVAHDTIKARR